MEKDIVKRIIIENQKIVSSAEISSRDVFFEKGLCYALTGIRRAGKSYLLYADIRKRMMEEDLPIERFLYVNFEDERISDMRSSELSIILDSYLELFGEEKPLVYLDEIQNIAGWEKFVRRIADSKYRVMLTGSNARMLSKEIATTLGGRYLERRIYTFSFPEYLSFIGAKPSGNYMFDPLEKASVIRNFNSYFHNGGFAEAFGIKGKREYLNSLYRKIIMGDIIAHNSIRSPQAIRMLAKKLAHSVMQPSSITRLQHILRSAGEQISVPTVKEYLHYMEEAYLIFSLPNYASGASEKETFRKYYFEDNGILGLFLLDGETLLFENMLAIDLHRRFQGNDEEQHLFFYRRNVEVDFYIPDSKMAVQACYSLNDEDREREVRALVSLDKAFPLERAVIVTMDQTGTVEKDGLKIEIVPLYKWLLS